MKDKHIKRQRHVKHIKKEVTQKNEGALKYEGT